MQRPAILDSHQFFLEYLRDQEGWALIYADQFPEEAESADIILAWGGAHGIENCMRAADLSHKKKIIYLLQGIHRFTDIQLNKMFACGNLWLSAYPSQIERRQKNLAHQITFFPQFYAPEGAYHLRWNRSPVMKCLLTGHTANPLYPIRHIIHKKLEDSYWQHRIRRMRHPRWDGGKSPVLAKWEIPAKCRGEYAQEIRRYFCSIATGSTMKFAVAKYFEIAAVGTLILGEPIKDIDRAGFAPWEHYIPITKRDVMDGIKYALENPGPKLDKIRKNARTLVRNNHSMLKRIRTFKKYLREI